MLSKEAPNNSLQMFCREAVLWGSLSHPDVLKLLGVLGDINVRGFSAATELTVYGNIMQNIKTNHANRLELVTISLARFMTLLILGKTVARCGPRSEIHQWRGSCLW